MRILRFKNVNDLASAVERDLRSLASVSKLRVFLPTGNSPRPLYKMLRQDQTFWSSRLSGIQIDEFEDPRRLFWEEIQREVGKPLHVSVSGWNPAWSDLEVAAHVEKTLSEPIDAALLGLGPNGHVGFHEPGQKKDFMGGRVIVSEQTMSRTHGAKTTKALTFGVAAFLKAKTIFLIVSGSDKDEVLRQLETIEPTEALPASLLKAHPRFTIYCIGE